MKDNYQLGQLIFTIKGNDKIVPHLREEFKSIKSRVNKNPDIVFDFKTPPKEIADGIYVSPVVCSSSELIYADKGFTYHLKSKNGSMYVTIQSKPMSKNGQWFPKLERMKNWNYLFPAEQIAKNFMYEVFDFITQIKNLENGQSYIHASSFKKGNQAAAVIAWGGVGKTTSMLKLVREDDWKFLSDDLGIIDHEGIMYRSPKKMQIYAYNLENESALKDTLLGGRSIADKFNWVVLKKKKGLHGVRRRVSAEELFGEKAVEKSAKLTTAFFIERANVQEIKSEYITPDALAQRSATIIMREINPFQTIETAVYSAQTESIIPRYGEVFKKTWSLLKDALSHTDELMLVQIPKQTSPNELANFLRTKLK